MNENEGLVKRQPLPPPNNNNKTIIIIIAPIRRDISPIMNKYFAITHKYAVKEAKPIISTVCSYRSKIFLGKNKKYFIV